VEAVGGVDGVAGSDCELLLIFFWFRLCVCFSELRVWGMRRRRGEERRELG
jgi:hypothetical protein